MKWSAVLLIISLFACKTRGPACIIDASDILKGAPKKLITLKDTGNRITALYDEDWDSLNGGAYLFYPNGFLKSYTFYQNKVPVYSENFDEHGYMTHTQGSPMVYRIIYQLGDDSAYVQVCFFKPMKTYHELNIQINKNHSVDYAMGNDTSYSNMKSVTFGININNLNQINMYSRIKYLDDCSKVEHILSDTLSLLKDPRDGLIPAPAK